MITPTDESDVEYLLLSAEQTWLGYAACGLILGRRQASFKIASLIEGRRVGFHRFDAELGRIEATLRACTTKLSNLSEGQAKSKDSGRTKTKKK